jgi:uncharacterized protein YwqG
VAQIDLAEQPDWLEAEGFPRKGLLLFFVDTAVDGAVWGPSEDYRNSSAVLFIENPPEAVVSQEFPDSLAEELRYRPVGLAPQPVMTRAPNESALWAAVAGAYSEDCGMWAFEEWVNSFVEDEIWNGYNQPPTQLGGFPIQLQGDLTFLAEAYSRGLPKWYQLDESSAEFKSVQRGALSWRLLLQVASVYAAGMFEHYMCYYFMIREEDLRERRFDRVWVIGQL